MTAKTLPLALSAAVLATLACGAAPAAQQVARPAAPEQAAPMHEASVPVGPVTRETVEATPEWVQAEVEAKPDPEAAKALAAVPAGAEVTVYLGTWCGDSRREVPRFWKALDAVGGNVPFAVRYVGVDRQKKEPAEAVAKDGVRYLPTFIVRRDGREVGRVVESSPKGIEADLLALLTGKAAGVISARQDLTPKDPSRK
ncbi:MAG TPA: thioredoxin family protein [Thermoanaerobaculia bacterium]|jgi:thiol-disulfide isomerase/thioredoxin